MKFGAPCLTASLVTDSAVAGGVPVALPAECLRGRPRKLLWRTEVLALLSRHIVDNFHTNNRAAIAWSVSPSFVTSVLKGRRPPPPWMLLELGYKQVETYVRIDREPETMAFSKRAGMAHAIPSTEMSVTNVRPYIAPEPFI